MHNMLTEKQSHFSEYKDTSLKYYLALPFAEFKYNLKIIVIYKLNKEP